MKKREVSATDKFTELRARAEQQLVNKGKAVTMSPEELLRTVHELHTHQIELELQNEDLRQAMIDLEHYRQRFSDLYDFAPVGYLTVSDKGLIIEANLTSADMLATARSTLLNQPLSAFILKEDQSSYDQCRQNLLQTKTAQQCELRMHGKDGQPFHAQLKTSICPRLNGDTGQYLVILTDVSVRAAFEKALLKSKKEWEATFDAMSDIVTLQDRDFHIVRANKAAHRMFGAELGGLIGKTCYEVFRGIPEICDGCPLLATNQDNLPHSAKIKHNFLGKTFLVSSNAITNDDGAVQCLIHTAKDVTELEGLETLLRQKYKMEAVGFMAGGIAHNFNNNLSIILGNIELAKMRLPQNREIGSLLDSAMIGIMRSRDLIQKILTYSCQGIVNRVPMKMALVVDETIKLIRSILPAAVVLHATIDPDASSAVIKADSTQIQEILINLCNNAIYAMAGAGELRVSLDTVVLKAKDPLLRGTERTPGTYVKISVQDTGCGMSAKIIDKIFDPFFTTKGIEEGSGMGLSTVQGIVEQYGGIIKVKSTPGKGSLFTVYFPQVAIAQQEPTPEIQALARGTEKILLVEDDPQIASLNEQLLAEMGYQVTMMTNSREALQLFAANAGCFDLVLSDQVMPELTGQELIREIKKHRPDISTILCTGYGMKINEEQAQQQGISAFLRTPVELSTLLKTIRRVLDEEKKN